MKNRRDNDLPGFGVDNNYNYGDCNGNGLGNGIGVGFGNSYGNSNGGDGNGGNNDYFYFLKNGYSE